MEDFQRETGIELRVVQSPSLQLSVLIMFDKVVIRMAGKGKGVQFQRIHRRQRQQPEVRFRRSQMEQIKGDQVMPEQKVRVSSEVVELRQCRRQVSAAEDQGVIAIRTHRGEGMNAVAPNTDFKVQ
ncbi:MAG: hypothetical protein OXF47_06945 [Nitrospira sp.]|nr:hypothetical protein [Nitrospira sp.]